MNFPLLLVALLVAQTPPDFKKLEARADAEYNSQDYGAAEASYRQILAVAESAGDISHLAFYYLRIAGCLTRRGSFADALDSYQLGIRAAESSGQPDLLEFNIHGAALALGNLRRFDESEALVRREIELARKIGKPLNTARALWMQAMVFQRTGNVREEIEILHETLDLSRAASDQAMLGIVLGGLCIAYSGLGDQ
jgi:tetratricopeptide (TPR) repeat protein